jgi:hypothetical protein
MQMNDMELKTQFFDAFASRPTPNSTIIRPAVSHYDANRLSNFLASKSSMDLSFEDIRTEIGGNLWMLAPEAFLYFLPAFLSISLESYTVVSVFVSELVGALTEPSRMDVIEAIDHLAKAPTGLGLSPDMTELIRKQQLEWFDSGTPMAVFHERFDNLTTTEGVAILAFFTALHETHGADFPFRELEIAVERNWSRYQAR